MSVEQAGNGDVEVKGLRIAESIDSASK